MSHTQLRPSLTGLQPKNCEEKFYHCWFVKVKHETANFPQFGSECGLKKATIFPSFFTMSCHNFSSWLFCSSLTFQMFSNGFTVHKCCFMVVFTSISELKLHILLSFYEDFMIPLILNVMVKNLLLVLIQINPDFKIS